MAMSLTSWVRRRPRWMGNDEGPEGFLVEVSRRISFGRWKAFLRALDDLEAKHGAVAGGVEGAEPPGVAELVGLFDGLVGTFELDGMTVAGGDFAALMKLAAEEMPSPEALAVELAALVVEVQTLGKAPPTSSGPSSGGGTGTPSGPSAVPAPAPAAAASPSGDSTPSAPRQTDASGS